MVQQLAPSEASSPQWFNMPLNINMPKEDYDPLFALGHGLSYQKMQSAVNEYQGKDVIHGQTSQSSR